MKFKLFIIGFILLIPATVLGAEYIAVDDVNTNISNFLINVVFPALSAVVLTFVSLILNKLKDKYQIEVSNKHREMILTVVKDGIAYAEENAAHFVTNGGTKITGNTKLSMAVNYVLKNMPKLKREDVENYINSVLAQTSDVGATKEKVIK